MKLILIFLFPFFVHAQTYEDLKLVDLANKARAAEGIKPVTFSKALYDAALAHDKDMGEHGCWGHDSCNGELWWKRVQRYYPGWYALAENVASGGSNAQGFHNIWMGSPGHRANIMNPSYKEMGAAIYIQPDPFNNNISYGTEDFGSRAVAPSPSPSPTPPPLTFFVSINKSCGRVYCIVILEITDVKRTEEIISISGPIALARKSKTNERGHINPRFQINRKNKGNYLANVKSISGEFTGGFTID